MNNTQPRDSSSDISDDNADDTDRTSHQWSIRQILDVRGGGDHPRFWLIWWQNTTRNGTTTRTFPEPTIGNGTSKETWVLDLQIGENRPILLYHKPSPVKRTSHEWKLHNILKRAPKNDVEQSVHEWSDPTHRARKLGHIQRLPTKPKRWIHGNPEKAHWYHPNTTNEQRQQWRQYYDTLVITGQAESQPNGSFYAMKEAARIHRKRELYQQK